MPRNAKQTQRTRLISLSIKRQGPNPEKRVGRKGGCVFDFSLAYETCERGRTTSLSNHQPSMTNGNSDNDDEDDDEDEDMTRRQR